MPSAWPTWLPNIAPPICLNMPPRAPLIAAISGGSCSASSPPGADIDDRASTTRAATGSASVDQTGRVAWTQRLRLHASVVRMPVGSGVTSSSQRSASRSASLTAWRLGRSDHGVGLPGGLGRHVSGKIPVDGSTRPRHEVSETMQGSRQVTAAAEQRRTGPAACRRDGHRRRGAAGSRTEGHSPGHIRSRRSRPGHRPLHASCQADAHAPLHRNRGGPLVTEQPTPVRRGRTRKPGRRRDGRRRGSRGVARRAAGGQHRASAR